MFYLMGAGDRPRYSQAKHKSPEAPFGAENQLWRRNLPVACPPSSHLPVDLRAAEVRLEQTPRGRLVAGSECQLCQGHGRFEARAYDGEAVRLKQSPQTILCMKRELFLIVSKDDPEIFEIPIGSLPCES